VEVTLADLFQFPTVGSLAAALARSGSAVSSETRSRVAPNGGSAAESLI
jgi:hypothetical protein